jgi:hypothetical protein
MYPGAFLMLARSPLSFRYTQLHGGFRQLRDNAHAESVYPSGEPPAGHKELSNV